MQPPEPIPTAAVELHAADAPLTTLSSLADQAQTYVAAAKATNTRRAYRADWSHFIRWGLAHGLPTLPAAPDTVVLYLTDLAARWKVSTLQRRLVAIATIHQAAQLDNPCANLAVREVMKGIRRAHGTAPTTKAPAVAPVVRMLVAALPDGIIGMRDRALLLLGYAGALRRSELVGLDAGDVQFTVEGLVVTLRRSKTDQEGAGRKIGIPYGTQLATCPVRAIQAWLSATTIADGPLFRRIRKGGAVLPERLSDQTVALIIKRTALAAGLDPATFSGHSLRAGLATQASMNGASERSIMQQTGHRSVAMVRRYIRDGELFRDNAATYGGL